MSFFSLLYGDKIATAPSGKVVPAGEFSALIDGETLLNRIREETERYRREVADECERLKDEAEKVGLQQGLDAWSEQVALLEQEIERVNERVAKRVLPIALKAAEKIVGREMSMNDETIADIVKNSLRSVVEHQRITIYCNKEDLPALEKYKEDLKGMFDRLESLMVVDRDDVQQGGCVIETEAGIINAQWDNQWDALKRAFDTILKGQ